MVKKKVFVRLLMLLVINIQVFFLMIDVVVKEKSLVKKVISS